MNHTLSRKQSDVLVLLEKERAALTQRKIEEKTGYSLGTVNKTIQELTEAGYIRDSEITNEGVSALEPYRAKRAVFIAAGFGSRMVPITFNTAITAYTIVLNFNLFCAEITEIAIL